MAASPVRPRCSDEGRVRFCRSATQPTTPSGTGGGRPKPTSRPVPEKSRKSLGEARPHSLPQAAVQRDAAAVRRQRAQEPRALAPGCLRGSPPRFAGGRRRTSYCKMLSLAPSLARLIAQTARPAGASAAQCDCTCHLCPCHVGHQICAAAVGASVIYHSVHDMCMVCSSGGPFGLFGEAAAFKRPCVVLK